jgi:pyruvate,water dikinase
VLVEGRAIGQKIGTGPVRVCRNISEMDQVQPGDVLVADMTDPNWEPVMKRAGAIVTNRGGRTCHAAIIARELGIPAVVGCGDATDLLADGALVTVVCSEGDTGYVYDGLLETEVSEVQRGEMPYSAIKIMMNVGNPQLAFNFSQLPNSGVGLARLEFIINNNIGVHPKAILDYPNIDPDLKKAVESVARGHASPRAFYVDKLAEGIATIAAAFWPKPVIVRLSDFKSNEYKKLIGGSRYEPDEENPMLGFRGASRYISGEFQDAFKMECEALKRVRHDMGLSNVEIMVPFVRTVRQAERVVTMLAERGLKRGVDGLRVIMMCEVPSNAILADQFLEHFDGMSIGSNDLTQLTLGLDRDSGLAQLAEDFDERDPAVKALISRAINACRSVGKYVGICGQGPSDHPDFAAWLADEGIVSISLNPDSVVETWTALAARNLDGGYFVYFSSLELQFKKIIGYKLPWSAGGTFLNNDIKPYHYWLFDEQYANLTPRERKGIASQVIHPQKRIDAGVQYMVENHDRHAVPFFERLQSYRQLYNFYQVGPAKFNSESTP